MEMRNLARSRKDSNEMRDVDEWMECAVEKMVPKAS
jgi:hypothetical protein